MRGESDLVLTRWRFEALADASTLVLPDGCCDIIWRQRVGQAPVLFATELAATPTLVAVARGDRFMGLRLRPGVTVDGRALSTIAADTSANKSADRAAALLDTADGLADELADWLAGVVRPAGPAAEALDAIAAVDGPLTAVAKALGVTPRTLQRTVNHRSGRSPGWWRRLARIRRAAAGLIETGAPIADVAFQHGYADQAHLTREARTWLGATPTALRVDGERASLLREPGYG